MQEAKKPTIATSGMGLNIVSRVGTRIYETVPGNQIVSLDVRDLSYTIKDNHLVFTFVMENRGNIILTPTGNFQIKDGSGKVFETIPLGNLGAVFPGKPTTITVTSKKDAPSFGQYIATVTVNYSSLKSITKSLTFFLFFHDWSVILPVLLLLLLIILFIIIKKYLSRKHKFQQIAQPEISTNKPQSASFAAKNISGENVDQVFIAHHIKLLGVAVLISVLVLSSLFAFILKDFVFSPIMPHAQGSSTQSTVPSNAPLSKQNTVPTETSIPINKADMKVIILNASGKAGVAKALGQKLSKDGFSVAKIANAEGTSTQTVIQYPIGKNEETDLLMEELKNEYASVTKEASDSAVFTIIIGK
ncbi:MAG: LytR C-terminal domain-containing protein [Candidatus Levyibacteriota bacterium]